MPAMALLNENHLKGIVAVGSVDKDGKYICDSTSFLIGFASNPEVPIEQKRYHLFLVTNRHVFEGRLGVHLRFNRVDGTNKIFAQPLKFEDGTDRWLAHPDPKVDLALLNVGADVLEKEKIHYSFTPEDMFAYRADFVKIGIAVADDVFAIGFPMGIAGEVQNYALVKSGIISRIDTEIIGSRKAFIIDSSIFPGNSGGPVYLKPSTTAMSGTTAVSQQYLIGVISAYLPYIDQLYTHQTRPPTVVSTTRENSGLTLCVPMDYVREIFDAWREKQKPIPAPQKNPNPEDAVQEIKTKIL